MAARNVTQHLFRSKLQVFAQLLTFLLSTTGAYTLGAHTTNYFREQYNLRASYVAAVNTDLENAPDSADEARVACGGWLCDVLVVRPPTDADPINISLWEDRLEIGSGNADIENLRDELLDRRFKGFRVGDRPTRIFRFDFAPSPEASNGTV